MSFSALPVELKEQIVLLAKLNDDTYRAAAPTRPGTSRVKLYLREKGGWDRWFGYSTMALSSTSRDLRTLASPVVFSGPLDLRDIPYEQLDECLSSRVGQCCRTVVLNPPRQPGGLLAMSDFENTDDEEDEDEEDDEDDEGDEDERSPPSGALHERSPPSDVLHLVLKLVADLPRLDAVVLPSDLSILQRLCDVVAAGNVDDNPDGMWPRADLKEQILAGSSPALTRIAAKVSSWTFPGEVPVQLVDALLSLTPTTVRHLVFTPYPRSPYGRLNELSSPVLAAAVAACSNLASLELSSKLPPNRVPRVAGGWTASLRVTPPVSLTRLTLHLDGLDSTLLRFLSVFPALQHLDLDLAHPSTTPLLRASAAQDEPPPFPLCLPTVSSLALSAQDVRSTWQLLLAFAFPALKRLSVEVADAQNDFGALAPFLALAHECAPAVALVRFSTPPGRPRWPATALQYLRATATRCFPTTEIQHDGPVDAPPASVPEGAAVQAPPPAPASSSARSAVELLEWAAEQARRAERTGDKGLARMLLGSAGEVGRLRRLLEE
ncbi:hypothetical protein JCM8097_003144 [Rhodosporidiobolus ruineniae]